MIDKRKKRSTRCRRRDPNPRPLSCKACARLYRWATTAARCKLEVFFYPCTYTSLPLNGMARNVFFYLHGYARSRNLLCLDPFYSYLLIPEKRKTIWSELELNPGPFASPEAAQTTRPRFFGLTHQGFKLCHNWLAESPL